MLCITEHKTDCIILTTDGSSSDCTTGTLPEAVVPVVTGTRQVKRFSRLSYEMSVNSVNYVCKNNNIGVNIWSIERAEQLC